MSTDHQEADGEFWSTEADVGRPAEWIFEGREGLARLSGPGTVTATADDGFRARLTRVQLDHVALEAFGATPHRYERTDRHTLEPVTPIVTFVLLAEGRLLVEWERGAVELCDGDCFIVDSRDAITYTADSPVRMLRSMVGIEHIPTPLQRRGTTLPAPLPRSPLIDAFITFVSTVLRATASGRQARSDHLVRAVADLQVAVLAEAQDAADRDLEDATLQQQIDDHIDEHLADPDLGPSVIAEALGISVRHAHGTFNEDERTIGRVIRERRLTAVATELRIARTMPGQEALAARYGFSGGAALQRAFRSRFGMSMSDYHRGGHRQLD